MGAAEVINRIDTAIAQLRLLWPLVLAGLLGINRGVWETIFNALTSAREKITSGTNTDIAQITTTLHQIETKLTNAIQANKDAIASSLSQSENKIINRIQTTANTSATLLANAQSNILEGVRGSIASVSDAIRGVEASISDTVVGGLAGIRGFIDTIQTRILDRIGTATAAISGFVSNVETNIRDFVQSGIQSVNTTLNTVSEKLSTVALAAIGAIATLPQQIAGSLEEVFAPGDIAVPEEMSRALDEGLTQIPALAGVVGGATLLPKIFRFFLSAGIIWMVLQELKDAWFQPHLERLRQLSASKLRQGILDVPVLAILWQRGAISKDIVYELGARNGIPDYLIDASFSLLEQYLSPDVLADAVIKGFANPEYALDRFKKQGYNETDFQVLASLKRQYVSPLQAIAAYRRGDLSLEYVRDIAQKQGFVPETIDILNTLYDQLLSEQDLLDALARGLIDLNQLISYLQRKGWTDNDIQLILGMFDIIPPISDIIRMAVREVFTPEIAESFGQFEDFPDAVLEWGRKQRLSEFWIRNYWAAHWDLPSIGQGFEMFQRDVITEEQLNLLLRALDVMPFWRDKLLQISYNVLTRVDLRRIYELDLIDDTELKRRLKHYGYSPEDVELIAEFYRVEKKFARLTELKEGRDLSKSEILSAYRNDLIARDIAADHLRSLHYADEEIETLIALEDFKLAKEEQDAQIKLIKQRYADGLISLDDVHDELGKLNLPARRVNRILTEIETLRLAQMKQPTLTHLLEWGKRGLLPVDVMEQEIIKLGYTREHAALFRQQIEQDLGKLRRKP